MNLKILMVLLIYYSIFIAVFATSGDKLTGMTSNVNIDDSALQDNEKDLGGLFGTGISFGRFFTLTAFGIGLSSSTPTWFVLLFGIWQTLITSFSIGFILDSLWSG